MTEAIESPMPPLREVTSVSVDRLVLDWRNPRLMGIDSDASDSEIIAQLYRSEDLSELLQSIAANGYLDIEPLVVLEDGDRLTVLEGNRRLAAIHLFREPNLAAEVFKGGADQDHPTGHFGPISKHTQPRFSLPRS